MKNYVPLHLHTQFSLLDCPVKINELVEKAKEYGLKALAITDHGNMFGVIDFYKLCKKNNIKPIIGCEFYVAPGSRFEKNKNDKYNHLILLAKNEIGYKNLIKLSSLAYLEGFYYKPRIDKELIEKHKEGLICLSACLAGEIPQLLIENKFEDAKEITLWYKNIFGEDFYLEIQENGLIEQKQVNAGLMDLARITGVKLVATNDIHYINKEDKFIQDVLLAINSKTTLNNEKRFKIDTKENYLKSIDEFYQDYHYCTEAVTNTIEIAEKCNLEIALGKNYLPAFDVPDFVKGENQKEKEENYFDYLCNLGMDKLNYRGLKEYEERLEYEKSMIKKMGYVGYFLIVSDFIKNAKEKGIMVGPGRGSAAGSLVGNVLEITNIDPIKYGLYFERFLNPERVSMPDIDVDLCIERRHEVFNYLIEKYGQDKVTQICTFGQIGAKMAIRDVARVLGYSYETGDRIAKLIPNGQGIKLKDVLEEEGSLLAYEVKNNDVVKKIVDIAIKIEGLPRQVGTHASGCIISPVPLTEKIPLMKTFSQNKQSIIQSQHMKDIVEEEGLLKMDLLGLKTLTVIKDAIEIIKRKHGYEIILNQIPLDDYKTYEMLCSGNTIGVFQLESEGIRKILKEMAPENIFDVIALVALYRPGPLGSGMVMDYIERKHGRQKIEYLHPKLEPILKETYGIILYQEQVMKISQEIAGFSLGQADVLRRGMGKKKPELIEKNRKTFIYGDESQGIPGALKCGVDEETATKLYDLMEYFAGYGFNKAHSAAYGLMTYYTAFLKANYPIEYMTALLNSVLDKKEKRTHYIKECQRLGIKIVKPSVLNPFIYFDCKENSIYYPLAAIKDIQSDNDKIILIKEINGQITDLHNFLQKVHLDKKTGEALIWSGAFDEFGFNRNQVLAYFKDFKSTNKQSEQINLFDILDKSYSDEIKYSEIKKIIEDPERAKKEKEYIGFYLTSHPLDEYKDKLINLNYDEFQDGKEVVLTGLLSIRKVILTKKQELMAFGCLEDYSGNELDVVIFPALFSEIEKKSWYKQEDMPVWLKAKVQIEEEEIEKTDDEGNIVIEKVTRKTLITEKIEHIKDYHKKTNIDIVTPYFLFINESKRSLLNKITPIVKENPGDKKIAVIFQGNDGWKIKHSQNKTNDEGIKQIEKLITENHLV